MTSHLRGACVFAIFVVVLGGALAATGECPENEEWKDCGSACPKTCKNYEVQSMCMAVCKKGCFCKSDLVRDDAGKCVEPTQCFDNRCPVGEVYKECGSACPPTCSNYGEPIICTAECKAGCFCKEGLVRNDDGKCVEPEQCPPGECPDNEIYKQCETACPLTCETYNRTDIGCAQVCRKGCFCQDGLVRNDDGMCVKPEECNPYQCPDNEEYKTCGTACPITCENFGVKFKCVATCVKGCFCKEGFIRNSDGICVEPNNCVPGGCPLNEQYSSCVNICNDCSITPEVACNFFVCNKGCDCIPGYTRSSQNNICIPKDRCPENNCPVNEVYSTCANPCNGCTIRGTCNFLLCNRGCDCRKGYYRDDNTGTCIPEALCPPS